MANRRPVPEKESVADALVREDVPPCQYFLSTGCDLLDLSVSDQLPGGVGSGRAVQLIGDNSTGKTVVAKEILGSAQRLGGSAIEEDSEYTPDFARAKLFGLDVGKWADEKFHDAHLEEPLEKALKANPRYCYRNPDNIEKVWDREIGPAVLLTEGRLPSEVNKKTGEVMIREADFTLPSPLAIGVDTFTALASSAEENRELDERSYHMERAKSMSAGFRKWIKHIGRTHTTIVAVDHIRSAVKGPGNMFGPDWTVSGGKAMQQYASTRILLANAGTIKNKAENEIGIWVRGKVIKNKIAPPFREVRFAILFDYGIDNTRSNIQWLLDQKGVESQLKLAGAWYSWGDVRLGQGLEAAITGLEEMGLEKELSAEVARVWKLVYEPPERKEKTR